MGLGSWGRDFLNRLYRSTSPITTALLCTQTSIHLPWSTLYEILDVWAPQLDAIDGQLDRHGSEHPCLI